MIATLKIIAYIFAISAFIFLITTIDFIYKNPTQTIVEQKQSRDKLYVGTGRLSFLTAIPVLIFILLMFSVILIPNTYLDSAPNTVQPTQVVVGMSEPASQVPVTPISTATPSPVRLTEVIEIDTETATASPVRTVTISGTTTRTPLPMRTVAMSGTTTAIPSPQQSIGIHTTASYLFPCGAMVYRNNVNIRSGPGTLYPVTGAISSDDTFSLRGYHITDGRYLWYAGYKDGDNPLSAGWIFAGVVTVQTESGFNREIEPLMFGYGIVDEEIISLLAYTCPYLAEYAAPPLPGNYTANASLCEPPFRNEILPVECR
jgi:hypothetical protein